MNPFRLVLSVVCLLSGLLVSPGVRAADRAPDPLLEPDQAFKLSVHRSNSGRVSVQFDVATGYYLYRDRFVLKSGGTPVDKNAIIWPKGKVVQDPTFGKVVTYRKQVRVLLPLTVSPVSGDGAVVLDITSQGCADAGVCFPPFTQRVSLAPGQQLALPAPGVARFTFGQSVTSQSVSTPPGN